MVLTCQAKLSRNIWLRIWVPLDTRYVVGAPRTEMWPTRFLPRENYEMGSAWSIVFHTLRRLMQMRQFARAQNTHILTQMYPQHFVACAIMLTIVDLTSISWSEGISIERGKPDRDAFVSQFVILDICSWFLVTDDRVEWVCETLLSLEGARFLQLKRVTVALWKHMRACRWQLFRRVWRMTLFKLNFRPTQEWKGNERSWGSQIRNWTMNEPTDLLFTFTASGWLISLGFTLSAFRAPMKNDFLSAEFLWPGTVLAFFSFVFFCFLSSRSALHSLD